MPEGRSERYAVYAILDAMVGTAYDALNDIELTIGDLQGEASDLRRGRVRLGTLRRITQQLSAIRRRAGPLRGVFERIGEEIEHVEGLESDDGHYLERIGAQLNRLVPIHIVRDLTDDGPNVARELALVKVAGAGDKRVESLRIGDIFRANVVDSTTESFVFEVVGNTDKVDAFIDLMKPLGLVEVSRTGVAAIARGRNGIEE